MRVLCLSKKWNHHTASGGYDRLVAEVGADEVRRRPLPKIPSRLLKIALKVFGLYPPYLLDYRFEDLRAEKELLARASREHPDVVHVLYGDEQLDLLLRSTEPLPCPLVVSFHLPTFRAQARFDAMAPKRMARIDAVVVLAKFQLTDYRKWFRADQLLYVPHGIDTVRFCPPATRPEKREIRLATVGTHMRDFAVIERVVQYFENRDVPVRFDVVDSYGHCLFLSKYKKVHLHNKLSEDDLIKLYQNADALLLPVISATANNSALESLACGTPVISTAIEGMPDYVDPASGWLFPKGEADGMTRLIEKAVEDPTIFSALRTGARKKSLEFSWDQVAARMREVYQEVSVKCKGTSGQ